MNSMIIIFLAVAAFAHGEQICTPNAIFKQYCNTCRCSEDGTKSACTKMYCDKTIFNIDGTLKSHISVYTRSLSEETKGKSQVCTPNSFFKVECNYCSCIKDGTGATCTMMTCPGNDVYDDKTFTKANKVQKLEANRKCTPGKVFKYFCNTCYCSEDGVPTICTKMYCDPQIFNEDGTMKIEDDIINAPVAKKVCEPGQVFQRQCNTCICMEDGTSEYCTYKDCGFEARQVTYINRVCEPGQVFKKDCNTCICSLGGTEAMCTLRDCDALKGSVWNYLGSTVGNRCIPGKSFKQDCNNCICGQDGRSALCTLLNCAVVK